MAPHGPFLWVSTTGWCRAPGSSKVKAPAAHSAVYSPGEFTWPVRRDGARAVGSSQLPHQNQRLDGWTSLFWNNLFILRGQPGSTWEKILHTSMYDVYVRKPYWSPVFGMLWKLLRCTWHARETGRKAVNQATYRIGWRNEDHCSESTPTPADRNEFSYHMLPR